MFEVFIIALASIWMIFAFIQDIKSKEIANWLNFSLLIFALGFRFFYSLFSGSFAHFYQGLIGFVIFFVLGNLLYHGRMFAGGDMHLMYALGAILPLSTNFYSNLRIFAAFFFIFFLVALVYTLAFSAYHAIKNSREFRKKFTELFDRYKLLTIALMALGLLITIFSFFSLGRVYLFFGLILLILPPLYIYTKAVDDSAMIKKISTKKLTEGDWLYSDVKIGKEVMKPSWSGLTRKQITALQKKKKVVRIRDGIAFSPVFLISFVLTVLAYYFVL